MKCDAQKPSAAGAEPSSPDVMKGGVYPSTIWLGHLCSRPALRDDSAYPRTERSGVLGELEIAPESRRDGTHPDITT